MNFSDVSLDILFGEDAYNEFMKGIDLNFTDANIDFMKKIDEQSQTVNANLKKEKDKKENKIVDSAFISTPRYLVASIVQQDETIVLQKGESLIEALHRKVKSANGEIDDLK